MPYPLQRILETSVPLSRNIDRFRFPFWTLIIHNGYSVNRSYRSTM